MGWVAVVVRVDSNVQAVPIPCPVGGGILMGL